MWPWLPDWAAPAPSNQGQQNMELRLSSSYHFRPEVDEKYNSNTDNRPKKSLNSLQVGHSLGEHIRA